ncbi:hypothetical protein K449DRAFT_395727 [Hypoxylon sp. EC38]|nr:hypothetical protein K449DRAFT_395727 [Hypoxylon sp. EC38]
MYSLPRWRWRWGPGTRLREEEFIEVRYYEELPTYMYIHMYMYPMAVDPQSRKPPKFPRTLRVKRLEGQKARRYNSNHVPYIYVQYFVHLVSTLPPLHQKSGWLNLAYELEGQNDRSDRDHATKDSPTIIITLPMNIVSSIWCCAVKNSKCATGAQLIPQEENSPATLVYQQSLRSQRYMGHTVLHYVANTPYPNPVTIKYVGMYICINFVSFGIALKETF